ncbi:MAG: diguanylate cyclase [Methylobacter sp.]
MKFIPSILLFFFGSAFLVLWSLDRKRRFMVTLAAGFYAFSFAMLMQVTAIPSHIGYNGLIAGVIYTASALLISEGVLERSYRHLSPQVAVLYMAVIVGGLWYFYFVDRNLVVWICVLNFGMGMIYLQASWQGRFLLKGTKRDKVLFWLLVVFGVHFLLRTLLTIESVSPIIIQDSFSPTDLYQTDFWQMVLFWISILGVLIGLGILGVLSIDLIIKLRMESDLDPLTGVFNRRGLQNHADKLAHLSASGQTSVVAVCDLDKFKSINDRYGHAVGDVVLTAFADIIRHNIRKEDVVARIGGEEFVIVFRDMTEEQAFAFSERIRTALECTSFKSASIIDPITCSVGLSSIHACESFQSSLERADKALYAAKRSGRNRICAE